MHVHRTGVSFTVHSHGSSYATCTYTGCPEVDSLQLAWMQCPSAWIRSTQSNQSERVKKGIFKCSIPAHMHGSIAGRIRRPGPQPHSTHGARLRVFFFFSFFPFSMMNHLSLETTLHFLSSWPSRHPRLSQLA